jgi:hypothetical protein
MASLALLRIASLREVAFYLRNAREAVFSGNLHHALRLLLVARHDLAWTIGAFGGSFAAVTMLRRSAGRVEDAIAGSLPTGGGR